MAKALEDYLARRPVHREPVEVHKLRMHAEVRGYRLRELREQEGLTQAQLAARLGVGRRQISRIEKGDLDNVKVSTLRGYLEAVGAAMRIEFVMGDDRVQLA